MHRVVSFSDIREQFPAMEKNRASIHGDVAALQKAGFKVDISGPLNNRIIELNDGAFTKKKYRGEVRKEGKQAIAEVAAGVIFGNSEPVKSRKLYGSDEENFNVTRRLILNGIQRWMNVEAQSSDLINQGKDVLAEIATMRRRETATNVMEKLCQYWDWHDKSLALDSGTTTEAVARKIMSYKIPENSDGLDSVKVFTNSRSIFSMLGDPDCNLKTVVIGGRQRHQTESICGELARRCLAAWDLSLGMSIVGATGVDTETLIMGSYNDEEAAMKLDLLSRSKIRIVVADSTKFGRNSFQITSKFAKIHPSSIDLIIVDSVPNMNEILRQNRSEEELGEGAMLFRRLLPVPVLLAEDVFEYKRKGDSTNDIHLL